MYEIASFRNFQNSLNTVKVMTKTKVAPFYLGHGVVSVIFSVCYLEIALIVACLVFQ